MKTLFTLLFSLSVLQSFADTSPASASATADTLQALAPAAYEVPSVSGTTETVVGYKKNIVKLNLSSLALNNYSLSYERSFNGNFSVVAGYSMLPKSKVTSLFVVEKAMESFLDEDDAFLDDLSAFTIANNTLTGELRYYAGKHLGSRGFYVSLYGRYMNTKINAPIDYESSGDKVYTLPFDGKIQGVGAGLMIGAQWLLFKNIMLDWYILGGHYGRTSIDLPASANLSTMTPDERRDMENDFESMNEDFNGKASLNATVTDKGVDLQGKAPFAGIRGFGFNIGYIF